MNQSIFNLALNFFRSPAEHDELVNPAAPLPPEISSLLDAIAGEKDPSAEDSVVVSDEMRAAISFLIRQSFFIPGADFYRVLGLNRGASADQIRKNYNQLMRIFLQGGEGGMAAWDTNQAMLVNRAYSVLREPEQRRIYDQGLQRQPQGRARAASPANPGVNPSDKISYFPGQGEQESPVPPGQPAAQKSASRSSYVAHSIDRVSSIPAATPEMRVPESLLGTSGHGLADEFPASPFAENSGGGGFSEPFPKAVPMATVSETHHHHSPVRTFFKSAMTVAVLAAIFIAAAVYILGTPPALEEEAAEVSPTVGTPPAQGGSVAREDSLSEPQAAAGNASSIEFPAQTAPNLSLSQGDTGKGTDSLSRETAPTPEPVASAEVSAGKSVSGEKRAAVAGTAGQVQDGKAAEPPVARINKTSGDEITPAKKLEAMRPPEAPKKTVAARKETRAPVSVSVVSTPAPLPVEGDVVMKQEKVTAASNVAPEAPDAEASLKSVQEPVVEPALAAPEPLVAIAPPPPLPPVPAISDALRGELDGITAAFSRTYEAGNLSRLMALFAEDASTNDQSSRQGIEGDYRDLFEQTNRRAFVFERVNWSVDRDGGYTGDGIFHVYVNLKGQSGSNTYDGRVTFNVQKRAQGLVITRMIHTYD